MAQASGAAEPGVSGPDWVRRPTSDDLQQVWPTKALRSGGEGAATITCKVSVQGVLYDCKVKSETPPGSGFGEAALALAPQFQMRPMMRDGKPVAGGQITLPIRWRWPEGAMGGGPAGAEVLSNIPWRKAPTFEEVLAAYPAKARAKALGGLATLACTYTRDGQLRRCETLNERPSGQGFGRAAQSLTSLFQGPPLAGDLAKKWARTQLTIAFAAETLNGERTIGTPQWTALPDVKAMKTAFPTLPAGVGTVRVMLNCLVEQGGVVSDCKVIREEPASQGVGPNALTMTGAFRLATWSAEGLPTVGGRVNIPIRYQLTDTPPPAPAKP